LARGEIAASQAYRAAVAAGEVTPAERPRAGNSHLDRMLASRFTQGPTAVNVGYGAGHRRGAYPSNMRGGKVPSSR
jgi:hypothetical protein